MQKDRESAEIALRATRSDELQQWMHVHAQNSGPWRAGVSKPPPRAASSTRISLKKFERALWERDHYRCCYCGIRVLHPESLRTFSKFMGPEEFPITGGNLRRHGIKMVFSATLDHVVPIACGGDTTPENLVTACWCCNYGKAEFTLDELGLNRPQTKPDIGWRGLADRL